MTREKEITKRLFEISTSNFNNSVVDSSAYFAGYIDGAKWADGHPHWISVERFQSIKLNARTATALLSTQGTTCGTVAVDGKARYCACSIILTVLYAMRTSL